MNRATHNPALQDNQFNHEKRRILTPPSGNTPVDNRPTASTSSHKETAYHHPAIYQTTSDAGCSLYGHFTPYLGAYWRFYFLSL